MLINVECTGTISWGGLDHSILDALKYTSNYHDACTNGCPVCGLTVHSVVHHLASVRVLMCRLDPLFWMDYWFPVKYSKTGQRVERALANTVALAYFVHVNKARFWTFVTLIWTLPPCIHPVQQPINPLSFIIIHTYIHSVWFICIQYVLIHFGSVLSVCHSPCGFLCVTGSFFWRVAWKVSQRHTVQHWQIIKGQHPIHLFKSTTISIHLLKPICLNCFFSDIGGILGVPTFVGWGLKVSCNVKKPVFHSFGT